jgi:hypothetical protein
MTVRAGCASQGSWPATAGRGANAGRLRLRLRLRLPGRAVVAWAAGRWSWPATAGLALGLLALGPGVGRGFLLSYDMVFMPDPPFSASLLGLSGGPARAVPSDAAMTVLARVIPASILQKIILLLIFVAACSGAAALLAAGWRQATGRPAPVLACLTAGCYYAWNPFVAERLLIGQWAMLLGYAGLPWVLRELCTGPVRPRPVRLLLAVLPAAVGGFAAMALTALAAVPAALARGSAVERCWRLVVTVAITVVLSLPWLIPSLLVPVHTDPRGVDLFAARADTPAGRLGSLIMLSGSWNSQTVPRGYGGPGSFAWLAVVACALAGYLAFARQRRWPGVGAAGLVGLVVAAIGVTSPTRAMLRDLVTAWPGFAVLRDGQQFVAALGVTEAIGLGAAVACLLTARGTTRRRTEPAAVALAVLAAIVPVVLLPGLAWGEFGRLRPVEYPADWLAARHIIEADQTAGSVLVLPWGAYRRYGWNHGEAVYDPWSKLLAREVVTDDGLQVGHQVLAPESAASARLNRIVSAPGPLTRPLRSAGVRYVVVDAGPLLTMPPAAVAQAARLPGASVVLDSRDLVVLRLAGRS